MTGTVGDVPAGLSISWITHHGRSADLARELGVECVFVSAGRVANPKTAPLRWALQGLRTVALLAVRRPGALVVMAPPWLLVAIALAYKATRLGRVGVVVDAHTSGVLSTRTGRVSRGLRFLGRYCDAVVTHNTIAGQFASSLAPRVVVLHDPPVAIRPSTPHAASTGPAFTFVVPCSWYRDEPVEAVLSAAAAVPEARFVLTGRPDASRLPAALPVNVDLPGYVDDATFHALLASADAVLALTTREATMQRAGYEAMAYGKPLVASDTRALRDFFGDAAVYADASPGAIADACRSVMDRAQQLAGAMATVRDVRAREFVNAVATLRTVLQER